MAIEKFTVHQIEYHRNGICGIGFYAVHFSWLEHGLVRAAIGTVDADQVEKEKRNKGNSKFSYNPGTRILMFGMLGGIDLEETMRGDHFHELLVKAILAKDKGD